MLAIALRAFILRLGTGIDRMFYAARDRLGLTQVELRWPISRILAHTVYWLVVVFFLAAVFELLALPGLADIFDRILLYLPLLVVWAVVVLAVYMASGLAAGAVTRAARASGLASAGLLGRVTRVFILTFAVIIAAGQLGVDVTLLVNVVTIATAVLLGGGAVAFGIGAGGIAGNVIAAHYVRRSYHVGQRVAVGSFEGEIHRDHPHRGHPRCGGRPDHGAGAPVQRERVGAGGRGALRCSAASPRSSSQAYPRRRRPRPGGRGLRRSTGEVLGALPARVAGAVLREMNPHAAAGGLAQSRAGRGGEDHEVICRSRSRRR